MYDEGAGSVGGMLPHEYSFPFMLVDVLILWRWKTAPSMAFIVLSVPLIYTPTYPATSQFCEFCAGLVITKYAVFVVI